MEVRALGPVELADADTTLTIDVAKHRALIATLALRGDDVTSNAEVIDALWGDDPPATATKTLQGYVSALRAEYGHDLIRTLPGGYGLGPAVDRVDVSTFELEVAAGRTSLVQHQPAAARQAFDVALRLWRGSPLDDLADGVVRSGQTARLAELHVLATEGIVEADLALGHHREVVPDLEQLVVEHPYREVLWQSLMLALYRSGRASAALAAYSRLRNELVEAFGLEPSPETQDLQRRVLTQDPALDLPAAAPPTNLPVRLDTFVDRVEERRSAAELLGVHRFVTVLGVGGVGKSRLAHEVGRDLLDDTAGGVWWIDLAAEREGVALIDLAAATIGVAVSPTGRTEDALLVHLRREPTLLVLDNCEHLRDAVAEFVEWVTREAPLVRVLATTRMLLDVRGAQQLVLQPLGLTAPADGHQPASGDGVSPAGQLFLDRLAERAESAGVDPELADSIGRLVDGLPLGIELAAAQCATTSAGDLARKLHDRNVLLTMTDVEHVDDRHPSLGHVLDASLDAIPKALAVELEQLAVFPGDFEVHAAAAVLQLPRVDTDRTLGRLLAASLISRSATDTARRRFRMLWPVREVTLDRLEAAERRSAHERLARHFHAEADALLRALDTPAEADRVDVIGTERHNVTAALQWFLDHDPDRAVVFGPALGLDQQLRGDQHKGRDLLRQLLVGGPNAPESHVAWAEDTLTWLEFLSGDVDAALVHNADAITHFEAIGTARGLARALRSRAHVLHLAGAEVAITTPLYQRSIDVARQAGLTLSAAVSQVQFAHSLTASERLDVVDVEEMLTEAEVILRSDRLHGHLAHAALSRGFIAFSRDDIAAARTAGEAMHRHSRLAQSPMWEQVAMVMLGVNAAQDGEPAESSAWLLQAVHLARDTDNEAQLGIALNALAATVADRAPDRAALLWGAGHRRSPAWPLFARRYGEWLDAARRALNGRFDDLVADGEQLSLDDVLVLVDSLA